MIATSGFLAALECTKFVFGRGPTGRSYSATPDPLDGIRGPTSKGRERERKEGGKGRKGRERRGGKTGLQLLQQIDASDPAFDPNQFGCRRVGCTIIGNRQSTNQGAAVVLESSWLILKEAFDSVNHNALLSKANCTKRIFHIVKSTGLFPTSKFQHRTKRFRLGPKLSGWLQLYWSYAPELVAGSALSWCKLTI